MSQDEKIERRDKTKDISIRLKKATDVKSILLAKVPIKLEMYTLDSIVAFIYKDSTLKTQKVLKNFFRLFSGIDPEPYTKSIDLDTRFWVILKSLELMVQGGLESYNAIKAELVEHPDSNDAIKQYVDNIDKLSIGYEDSKKLIKKLDDRLRFGYVITIKNILREFLDAIDDEDYNSYKEIADDLEQLAVSILNIRRNTNSLQAEDMFCLDSDKFEESIYNAVARLQDKMKMFKTGIKGLNILLAPAYMSKRLYLFLAFPGGGKSQMLLKSALDIKKYNAGIKTKDPNKIPAVLYITMENTIDETVERIFNMLVSSDDIRNYTAKQVCDKLVKGGQLSITGDNNIDFIMMYYPNRSICTDDLYGIIDDLNDNGKEVIALVLDYIKRIAPTEKAENEKGELKNISNELKSLAVTKDIPVITAQQLNRVASSVVDSALQAKKEDLGKLIGREGIAGAWELLENVDWCCVLNQEVKRDTDILYMTFKLIKRRYRSAEEDEKLRKLEYFNQPYEPGNSIRLMDDVGLSKPLMVLNLSEQNMVGYEDVKRGKVNAVEREDKAKAKLEQMMEFDSFDIDQSIQY